MTSALDTVIRLDAIVDSVLARQVPLAAETAGYLLIDLAGACGSDSLSIDPAAVVVSEEGVVALVGPTESAEPHTEASLRRLLGALLAAGGSTTPALQAAADRAPEGQRELFVAELEAALIPLNRAAGRRAVARLAREARRVSMGIGRHGALAPEWIPPPTRHSTPPEPPAVEEPSSAPGVPEVPGAPREEVRIEPLAPPPAAVAAVLDGASAREPPRIDISELPTPESFSEAVDAVHESPLTPRVMSGSATADESQEVKALEPPPPADVEPPTANLDAPDPTESVEAAPTTTGSHALRLPGLDGGVPSSELSFDPRVHTARIAVERADASSRDARKPTWRAFTAGGLALVAFGVAVGLKVAGRGDGTGADALVSAFRAGSSAGATRALCEATLTVEGIPVGTELFRRMGTAPLDVPRMPVGARLEWVALADGHQVRRAVIPAGVPWNHGAAAARYELAIQLDPSKSRGADPWPAAEPGPQVGGAGSPGLVHIVTSPPGAELFLFSGVAPEATLAALPCDASFDLLLAGPRDERRRVVVGSSEFVKATDAATGGERRAARVRLDARQ